MGLGVGMIVGDIVGEPVGDINGEPVGDDIADISRASFDSADPGSVTAKMAGINSMPAALDITIFLNIYPPRYERSLLEEYFIARRASNLYANLHR